MTNHVAIGAVTHTRGNLINNKKINIYTIFMCFLRKKIRIKHINMVYFLYHKRDKLEFVK